MLSSKYNYAKKGFTPKSNKLNPGVDLTAMVSLSFLLMVFFMFQSFIKKPNAMDLTLPEHYNESCGGNFTYGCGGEWRVTTLLLGDNNKLILFQGHIDFPFENEPKVFIVGSNEFKKEITRINEQIKQHVNDPEKEGQTVIIKPCSKCLYKDVVTTINEVENIKVRNYSLIHQLNEGDKKLLKENNL